MDDPLNEERKSDLEDDNMDSDQERFHFDEGENGEDDDDGERIDDPEAGLDELRDSGDSFSKDPYSQQGKDDQPENPEEGSRPK